MAEPNGKRELAESQKQLVPGIVALFNRDRGATVEAYFDPQTPDGMRKLIQAQIEDIPDLQSQANRTLLVSDYMCHPASKTQNDGEVKSFIRTVIFTHDGKAFDAGSMGIDKSVHLFLGMLGPPPWNPPVKCDVKVTKLDGVKIWLTLMPDIPDMLARKTVREVPETT